MKNPYQTSNCDPSAVRLRRDVLSLTLAGIIVLVVAVLMAAPALYLLNQEVQIIPTESSFYMGSINGIAVSNGEIIVSSITIAFCFVVIATKLLVRARSNFHHNSLLETDEQQT